MRSRMAKVLHPLCGRTMLGWTLHAVAGLEPTRIAVIVGHQAEGRVEDCGGEEEIYTRAGEIGATYRAWFSIVGLPHTSLCRGY